MRNKLSYLKNHTLTLLCCTLLTCSLVLSSKTQAALFNSAKLWTTTNIPVCFVAASFNEKTYSGLRSILQRVVENEFAPTGIKFNGWGNCNSGWGSFWPSERISVKLGARLPEGVGGQAIGIGPSKTEPNMEIGRAFLPGFEQLDIFLELKNNPDELQKVQEFFLKSYECAVKNPGANDQKCNSEIQIKALNRKLEFYNVIGFLRIVVHEFGHSIGLLHEQDRSDVVLPKYKCFSPYQPFPRSGENYVSHPKGQADCESLMFTSFLNTALGSPFLSKYDVEAIRIAYKLK